MRMKSSAANRVFFGFIAILTLLRLSSNLTDLCVSMHAPRKVGNGRSSGTPAKRSNGSAKDAAGKPTGAQFLRTFDWTCL